MSNASIEKQMPSIAGINEKHTNATSINPEEGIERISLFDIQKPVFGIDIDGKSLIGNDKVEILTHPYNSSRNGVVCGGDLSTKKCIIEFWDPVAKRYKKIPFDGDQLRKIVS